MERLLKKLDEHPDIVVAVTTGTGYFAKGEVKLLVGGDGTAVVLQRARGKEKTYRGQLSAAEVRTLGAEYARAGFTTLRTKGPPRDPGDTPVSFEISRGAEKLYTKELWYADRFKMPGLDAILKRYEAIVVRLTGGQLPY